MVTGPADPPALARRLSLSDAVMIGLGSMIGAGVFAVFAPAAQVAGAGLLIGLGLAAVVAFCNATSSAQLAAQYPTSGGTYVFGRERLGEWPGFFAGWSFVVGKSASCAAMALTFAAYVVPGPLQKAVAVVAVIALVGINLLGVTRTAALTKILVSCVLVVLVVVIVIAVGSVAVSGARGTAAGDAPTGGYGILQSAGLLFFAFAGYARIATMGEEVRNPSVVIPRAIVISLTGVLALYATLGVLLLTGLGPQRLASSDAPLITLVVHAGASWMTPAVQIAAALAALGALLALIAGIGRTTLAMARTGDLPRTLAAIDPTSQVPRRAETVLAVAVCALVVLVDLRQAIGFSSFGVLLYYFVANVAAFTQDRPHRRYPRPLPLLGAAGCLILVVTLPWQSIVGGAAVVGVGILYRLIRLRRRPRRSRVIPRA
ncbi:APC family permease [Microbacterium sp. P01]|uniref:APC family permease n=1 Tax=unclassified Microbacterium TaxID=2609290 RepID=UPI00366DF0C1